MDTQSGARRTLPAPSAETPRRPLSLEETLSRRDLRERAIRYLLLNHRAEVIAADGAWRERVEGLVEGWYRPWYQQIGLTGRPSPQEVGLPSVRQMVRWRRRAAQVMAPGLMEALCLCLELPPLERSEAARCLGVSYASYGNLLSRALSALGLTQGAGEQARRTFSERLEKARGELVARGLIDRRGRPRPQ